MGGDRSAEVTLAAVAAKAAAVLRGGAQSCETVRRLGHPSKSVSSTSKPAACDAREGKKSQATRVTVGMQIRLLRSLQARWNADRGAEGPQVGKPCCVLRAG